MPYVTSAERIGIEKGRLEGRDEGKLLNAREMVLEALDAKFSSIHPGFTINYANKPSLNPVRKATRLCHRFYVCW